MTYTADHPPLPETPDQLRARIPGWGADLDPADRPSYPRERFDPGASGARWDFPERQPELAARERSIEHGMLPPVFGTAQPLHGVSGAIRRHAYRRYSEARSAHWLLLIAADRVDTAGARVRSLASARPDDPVTETGVLGEARRHGWASRAGQHRADVHHQWLDPVLVAGPWLAAGALGWAAVRVVRRRRG
ncbi:hypothetical protein ACFFOM_02035 [Microlunatus capsulatus]|uniref:Uncharacterized protein n=1 Tax=Microlunatus capsulatus TaxID=99117 RepID=A0ABS4Z5E1_9ACTN|nr:hypothetical protein [Microlunatus capsulatus]MBP2415498.1 hypothetical protein [Microlunatus capsulatus]